MSLFLGRLFFGGSYTARAREDEAGFEILREDVGQECWLLGLSVWFGGWLQEDIIGGRTGSGEINRSVKRKIFHYYVSLHFGLGEVVDGD